MIEALNRTRGRASKDATGQFNGTPDLLADPGLQPMLKRLGENICVFSPIDRVAHAKNIAAAIVAARGRS